jgi:hypothetical protein
MYHPMVELSNAKWLEPPEGVRFELVDAVVGMAPNR